MQVYHGSIITCDEKNTVASYLVEKEGRIAFIGDDLPEMYANLERIELGKGALIPAFVDTFSHYSIYSYVHELFYIENAESNAQILTELRKYAANNKDSIIIGFGASGFSVAEGHLILKEQLDAVIPDRPVCLIKYDGRSCIVNTAMIRLVKERLSGIRGFNEATGEVNNESFNAVMETLTKGLSTRKVIDAMLKNTDLMAKNGLGMICCSGGMGAIRDTDVDMENAVARGLDNGFQLRITVTTMDVDRVIKKGFKTIDLVPLDGHFGNEDAALIDPYLGTTDRGILYYTDEELLEVCKYANRKGLQIRLRACGDAAFAQATRVLRDTLEDYPRFDHRHTVIHASLPTKEGIDICSKYHILLSCQPGYIEWPMETEGFLRDIIGDRVDRLSPIKDYLDAGITVCFSSNAPSTVPDPVSWIHKVCNNAAPGQAVSVQDALKMATYNGYYSSFDERERGSLEVGKIADMVVLDNDPYFVPVDKLKNIRVSQLYVAGRPYEHSKIGAMTTMLRGMFPQ